MTKNTEIFNDGIKRVVQVDEPSSWGFNNTIVTKYRMYIDNMYFGTFANYYHGRVEKIYDDFIVGWINPLEVQASDLHIAS